LVFNLGDAAITIGVLVLLGRALLVRDKPKASRASVENINA
jgi:signal peptidase II